MKFIAIFLKHASLQFLWGTLISLIILGIWGSSSVTQVSDVLCVSAGIFLFFIGPIFLIPKEVGFNSQFQKHTRIESLVRLDGEHIRVDFEPTNNDTSLLGLSEKEQKKYLILDRFIVFVKVFGISLTLFFYAIFIYQIFGN